MTRLPRPRRRVPRRLASGQGTTPLDRKATIPSSLSGPAHGDLLGRAAKKDALRRCITTMGHRHVRVRREPDRYADPPGTQGETRGKTRLNLAADSRYGLIPPCGCTLRF